MDFLEYTNRRIVMADHRNLTLILGYSFIGAGIILLLSMVKTDRYFIFGLMLLAAGIAILGFSSEQTYITLDREAGQFEIQRRPLFGKVKFDRFRFDQVTDLRTVQKEGTASLRYRIEVQVDKDRWIPLTHTFQRDTYGFETTEGKLRAFLDAAAQPLTESNHQVDA